jgi:hypothetical protein
VVAFVHLFSFYSNTLSITSSTEEQEEGHNRGLAGASCGEESRVRCQMNLLTFSCRRSFASSKGISLGTTASSVPLHVATVATTAMETVVQPRGQWKLSPQNCHIVPWNRCRLLRASSCGCQGRLSRSPTLCHKGDQ